MNDYKLHLTEEQIRKLEDGVEDIGEVRILTPDGRVIKTDDMDMVDIILGMNKQAS